MSRSLTVWFVAALVLLLAIEADTARAQYWDPYLDDRPTQHAIMGHVAGLGPVVDEHGTRHIVEYDPNGFEVQRVAFVPGMSAVAASSWNADVDLWTDATNAAGEANVQTLGIDEYKYIGGSQSDPRQCFDTSAQTPAPVPDVAAGVRWILVRKVNEGLPACDGFVLAVSTHADPLERADNSSSLIVDSEGTILYRAAAGNVFAFESAYFEAQAGYCPENPAIPSPVIRNLVAYQACNAAQVNRIWAPIYGAVLDTTDGMGFSAAVTDPRSTPTGFFRLDYTSRSFDDQSGAWVWGEVYLDAFNPRFPSSRKFYLKKRVTGAGIVKRANFAIDLVQASVSAAMYGSDGKPLFLVDRDFEFDEFTEFEYTDPNFTPVEPANSFENHPNVYLEDLGLVSQVSAIDLMSTDVYLYRVADGKLIGARRGMTPSNLMDGEPTVRSAPDCEGGACLGLVMLTRGPASRATAEGATSLGGTAAYQSAVTSAGGSPNQVSLELEYLDSTPAIDFLRPGDVVQLVMVNRVTGYMGSAYGRIDDAAAAVITQGEDEFFRGGQLSVVDLNGDFGLNVEMHPPNLRVQAKRSFDVAQGQTQTEGTGREYIIGFEGASLNTDRIVEITTEWVDHDGKPLPADLPGFTGRLASVVDDALVGEGDAESTSTDQLGHFAIRPGTHTQVARVPMEHLEVGHLYIHIDAAPSDQTVDFKSALLEVGPPSFDVNKVCYWSNDNQTCFDKPLGSGTNPLEERPAHLVPFKVPIFDEKATRQLAVEQRAALQEAWTEGETLPILEKVDPVYQWLYRPEFKFSVLDLDVKSREFVTDDQGTRLVVDYTLVGGDDSQQLDPLGDNEFVFSLGYRELLATLMPDLESGEVSRAEFDDVAGILGLTTGGQLDSQADVLGAILGPEDFLVLQLYLQHDSANGLFEFAFGADLNLFADVRTLEVERVHRRARYEHHLSLPDVPAYTDSYEFLSFETKHESLVTVVTIDDSGTEEPLFPPATLPPDRHRFVIDYQQLVDAGITPKDSPTFRVEIRSEYLDENGEDAGHTVAYQGVIREREQGEVIGQTIVNDVAVADGSLRLEREDFRVKGKGPDLAFVRTYSSSNVSKGTFGQGWRHQLEHRLVPIEAGDPSSTTSQDAGIPDWVQSLKGRTFGTDEAPPANQEWIEVLVSGTRFRKFVNDWYPERGRHGSLEERTTPDGDEFIYTAMDGTRYRYLVPSLVGAQATLDEIPVTVGDAAVYRVGLPPLLNCPFVENVLDITAPNGHTLEFKYSGDNESPGVCGELVSVVEVDILERTRRSIDLTYGSVPLTDPVSQELEGSTRRLLSVAGPGGIALSFGYDEQGRLSSATRASRVETYEYPVTNRDPYLTRASVDPGHDNPTQAFDYSYHQEGELLLAGSVYGEFLDPKQIVKSVTLPMDALGGRASVDFEYDFGALNERRVDDANGELATYRLDDVGRPIAIVGPAGRDVGLEWDSESGYTKMRTESTSAGSRVTRYQYIFNLDHRLARTDETGPYQHKRITVYDPRFNKPVSRTDRNGFEETWQYDIFGNPMFYQDGDGQRWSFEYDSERLLRSRGAPGRTNLTHFTYDLNGYVRNEQTETGDLTETFYDDRGLLRERVDPRENSTFYSYDDLDNLIMVERPGFADTVDARPEALSTRRSQSQQLLTWDALGRKVSEIDHNGLKLDYEYDGRGLVTGVTRPMDSAERVFTYDANGNLLSESDWKGVPTSHTYNALNQRETTTNRLGGPSGIMTYQYDPVGNLLQTTDYAGVKTVYAYDLLGRPLTMIKSRGAEPTGAQVEWEYYLEDDSEQNLKKVTVHRAPLAQSETTEFTINGRYQRLTRTNARGRIYQWVYNLDGTIHYETDEEGLTTQRRYFGDGRVRFEDVIGASTQLTTEFEYDPAGNVTAIIDPKGNRVERDYDEWNRMIRSHVLAEGNARFTTHVLYDGEGNVLNVRDPADNDRSTLRDALGRVTETIAGDGGRVTFMYDPNGNVRKQTETIDGRAGPVVTDITYDAEDREDCRTEAFGAGDVDERRRCVLEYDGVGNPTLVEDFLQAQTRYAYDVNHQLIEAVLPGNDTLGWTYSQNGLLVAQRDATPNETEFDYDELGRLVLTTDPAVEGVRNTEQRSYDEVGNLIGIVDRGSIETRYAYDELYRLREVKQAGEVVAVYGYDSVGNLAYEQDGNCDQVDHCYDARNLLALSYVRTGDSAEGAGCSVGGTNPSLDVCPSQPQNTDDILRQYDRAGNLLTLTNEAEQDTTFTYDGENRVLTEAFAGETTVFTYDQAGLVRARTRLPSGRTDTFEYDMLGRLKTARDGGLLNTTYVYDDNGNLTLTTLPSGAETVYTYDPRNQVETQVQDLGGLDLTTRFTYDENDNVETLTDANGQLISYDYDEKNRRKSADYPPQSGAPFYEVQRITWGYDGNDNVKEVQALKGGPSGQIVDVTSFDYDARDRLEVATYRGRAVRYAYDRASQRVAVGTGPTIVEGGSNTTFYKYDARGRVTGVVTPAGQAGYQYTPDGRLYLMTQPNGVATDYSYTAQNRVDSIRHRLGGTTLAQYDYGYDPDGNRLSETATQVEGGALVQQTRQMAYDLANRLCAVAQGQGPLTGVSLPNCDGALGDLTGVEETRYAFFGYNRDRETVLVDGQASSGKVYDYDAANRLLSVDLTDGQSTTLGTLSYGYDRNGNTLSVTDSTAPTETMGFVYNPRDQLVQVTRGPPGSEVVLGRYDYDAQGQRIRTEALGALTEEVYDGIALLARYQGGSEDAFVHRGPSGELLGVEAPSTPMQWVHTDVLGSPIVRTDDVGGVVSSTRYGVFGDVALHEETGAAPGPRFGFTGHQYDAGTELVYANARYYQPGLGRFLTQDAFLGRPQQPASLHRYLYAAHSPAVLVDPTGNFPWTERRIEALELRLAERDDLASDLIASNAQTIPSEGDEARASQLLHELIRQNRADAVSRMFWEAADGGLDIVAGLLLFTNDAERKRSARRTLDRVLGIGQYLRHEVEPALVFPDQTLDDLIEASEYLLELKEGAESGDPAAVYEFAKVQTMLELELATAAVPPLRGLKLKPGFKGGGKAAPDVPRTAPGGGSGRPEFLDRVNAGNDYNRAHAFDYTHREVPVRTADGRLVRVDAYTPGEAIVERKFTQLAEIQEGTALGYLRQLQNQYPVGARIADVPSAPPRLRGQVLSGQQILEVPIQNAPVPRAVLDAAAERGVIIRDVAGTIYQ